MSTNQVVINDVEPRTQSIATGGQVTFNTNWTADAATDILVYSRASDAIADDQTQLVSQDDYAVEFVGTYQTVRITFSEGRTVGDIVTISRATPSDRENLYTNTNFTPSMLNQDFGILTLVDQQNQMFDQDLCPHYNISATYTNTSDIAIDVILPILDANEFWVKNPGNTAITKATLDTGGLPAAGPFLTYTADSTLVGAFDMGLLASGIIAQNVASSIATPYIISIPMSVANGGSGRATLTPNAVLLGGSSPTAAMSQVADLGTTGYVFTSNGAGLPPSWQAAADVDPVPIGTIIDFAATAPPAKYLTCDGSSVSTTTYAALFAVIGYIWGGSGGSFSLPNLQGYVTAGSGGTLPPLTNTVGSTGGAATHTLTEAEMPSHHHSGLYQTNSSSTGGPGGSVFFQPISINTGNTGGSTAHTIVQPTAIVLKCIKYQ